MRHAYITMGILFTLTTSGCATWGTHVKTAGTLAEYLVAECGDIEGKREKEQCVADELARWAECAAESDAGTETGEEG